MAASNSTVRAANADDAAGCTLYRRVGWKHDHWHDVAWMQVDLSATASPDGPPTPIV